jgi:hypothetical protein
MTTMQGPLGGPEGQVPLGEPDYLRALEGKSPGCTCPGTADVLMAEINGEPRPLCAQHDAAEIEARAERDKREALEAEAGRLRFLREQALASDHARHEATEAARADSERAEALAELREEDEFLADLVELVDAPIPQVVPPDTPIGDDETILRELTRALGITTEGT